MNLLRQNLLFISADHFHACSWNRGSLSEAQYFGNDANGREQFSGYLQQHREPTYLLTDVIEEDFRHEIVPHLIGKNRQELIKRKFEQFYHNTLFRQAQVQHRQTEGRRDDEILFSALTNPQRISPWLDILLHNGIPIIGIYSLPNISTPLLKGIESDHVLLLSWEKHAGLRETYFNKKRLRFSRLTHINDDSSYTESVKTETPRTQQYLKSLSLPPPGEVLDVYIICHIADRLELESSLQSTDEVRFTFADIQTLGNNFKAKTNYRDSDATPLFLHLLVTQPPTNHYANATHTHYYLLWQLRWILYGLTLVFALSSALWSGISLWQGRGHVSETRSLLSQSAKLTDQAGAIQRQFPVTTIPAADMKTAVTIKRKLSKYSPAPEEILSGLTAVLEKFLRIRSNAISWGASSADAPPSIYPAQVITFDGELLNFGTDFRGALAYLENFQQALTQRGYTVSSPVLPLDISPKGSISGDLQANPGKSAQFTLKLIWRNKE